MKGRETNLGHEGDRATSSAGPRRPPHTMDVVLTVAGDLHVHHEVNLNEHQERQNTHTRTQQQQQQQQQKTNGEYNQPQLSS